MYCCCTSMSCLRPHELYLTRRLCPWDSPGKNTGVGCHFLLLGIFLSQGLNPHLLHRQVDFLITEPPGKPSVAAGGPENKLNDFNYKMNL